MSGVRRPADEPAGRLFLNLSDGMSVMTTTSLPRPRRRAIHRILSSILAAVLPRIATASPPAVSCAAAVRAAAQALPSWPRYFSGVHLRDQAMIHLSAAAQAAMSGNEPLCWRQFAASGYKPDQ
jgi:hypothetical protein